MNNARRGLVVDYYGVINPDRFTQAYAELGGDPLADEAFIKEAIRRAHDGSGPPVREVIPRHLGISVQRWIDASVAPNDQRLLQDLRAIRRANHRVALLTNVSRHVMSQYFAPKEADGCFDAQIASAEVGIAKPDPRIFTYAAGQIGVAAANCVLIDDSLQNCAGAIKAGYGAAIRHASLEETRVALQELGFPVGTSRQSGTIGA